MLFLYVSTIVQIVLESFPVSSSGHCALMACIMYHFSGQNISDFELNETINFFIQIPTVIVLALFFFGSWSFLIINYRRTWRIILSLILFTILVDFITAFFFFVIKKYCVLIPLWIGFLITSLLLLSLRWCSSVRPSVGLSWQLAVVIGIVQGVASLPGISRFGAVYTTLRWMGFENYKAFQISWMVFWPLLIAAFLKSVAMMMIDPSQTEFLNIQFMAVIAGAAMMGFSGMYVVSWLVNKDKIWLFSIYMIVPSLLAYWYCR